MALQPGGGRPADPQPDGTVKKKRKRYKPGEPRPPRGRPRKHPPPESVATPAAPAAPPPPPPPPVSGPEAPALGGESLPSFYFPDVSLDDEPLDVLKKVMRDPRMHPEVRMRATQAALPFTTNKPGVAPKDTRGKKETATERAAETAKTSRFAASRPPLRAVGGK